MGLFIGNGMKEYKAIAAKNNGKVAILFETRNGKSSSETRLVFIVDTPRKYSIKMNELKCFFESAFDAKFPVRDEFTYCKYSPIDEKFILSADFIKIMNSGEEIKIRKTPYYAGFLDR